MSIAERLQSIRDQIGNRNVTIVAVSKYASNEALLEAWAAGLRDFGENKVQDAVRKMEALPAEVNESIRWHFIGHLQTNKVKSTVGRFSLVQSVDSVKLAHEISHRNAAKGMVQNVLLQVNLSNDPDRFGFDRHELARCLPDLASMEGMSLKGLMGMAPNTPHVPELKTAFAGLKSLRDELESTWAVQLPEISMGMSHDYVHALECGATMIRIGNYLFQG